MRKKVVIVTVCVAIAAIIASGQYVHRGYVGVIESGDDLRLLDHGPHLKAPWQRATIYPIQSRDVHLEAYYDGPMGKTHFDAILLVSICRDSVRTLHREYRGAYVERLVSPCVADFIRDYGDAYGIGDGRWRRQEVGEAIAGYLNLTLAEDGINICLVRPVAIEIVDDQEGDTIPHLRPD
jgi:hypothetical protein